MVEIQSKDIENTNDYTMMCKHCKERFAESKIQEHHLHPRFMDNKPGNGMKIGFCTKCHGILHGQLMIYLWQFVPEENKPKCIKRVIEHGKMFGGLE